MPIGKKSSRTARVGGGGGGGGGGAAPLLLYSLTRHTRAKAATSGDGPVPQKASQQPCSEWCLTDCTQLHTGVGGGGGGGGGGSSSRGAPAAPGPPGMFGGMPMMGGPGPPPPPGMKPPGIGGGWTSTREPSESPAGGSRSTVRDASPSLPIACALCPVRTSLCAPPSYCVDRGAQAPMRLQEAVGLAIRKTLLNSAFLDAGRAANPHAAREHRARGAHREVQTVAPVVESRERGHEAGA
jgi:hypothetical protein